MQEFLKRRRHRQSRRPGPLPVQLQPAEHAVFRPADKGILEQRRHVVTDRPVHGILKIENARVRIAVHQVARHIVAVHIDLALTQRPRHQQIKDGIQLGTQGRIHINAKMLFQIPLGKQLQLAAQQGLVVDRQHIRLADALNPDQGINGATETLIGIVLAEHRQPGFGPHVRQQQKAARQVLGDDMRHMHTGIGQQPGNTDKWPAIFLRRRRIHADQAALAVTIGEFVTKIASERGICRGRQATDLLTDLHGNPCIQRRFALILGAFAPDLPCLCRRLHCHPLSSKLPSGFLPVPDCECHCAPPLPC